MRCQSRPVCECSESIAPLFAWELIKTTWPLYTYMWRDTYQKGFNVFVVCDDTIVHNNELYKLKV